eukprot:5655914-Prymnesium_polylepis.1
MMKLINTRLSTAVAVHLFVLLRDVLNDRRAGLARPVDSLAEAGVHVEPVDVRRPPAHRPDDRRIGPSCEEGGCSANP